MGYTRHRSRATLVPTLAAAYDTFWKRGETTEPDRLLTIYCELDDPFVAFSSCTWIILSEDNRPPPRPRSMSSCSRPTIAKLFDFPQDVLAFRMQQQHRRRPELVQRFAYDCSYQPCVSVTFLSRNSIHVRLLPMFSWSSKPIGSGLIHLLLFIFACR